jgi:hypothetical protein
MKPESDWNKDPPVVGVIWICQLPVKFGFVVGGVPDPPLVNPAVEQPAAHPMIAVIMSAIQVRPRRPDQEVTMLFMTSPMQLPSVFLPDEPLSINDTSIFRRL